MQKTIISSAVALLVTALMLFVGAVNIKAEELTEAQKQGWAISEYDSAELYVADCLARGYVEPETGYTFDDSLSMRTVNDTYSTYEQLAEALCEDTYLVNVSVFWTNLNSALSLDFQKMSQQHFYELILMDYLAYEAKSYEYQTNYAKKCLKYEWQIYKNIVSAGESYYNDMMDNAALSETASREKMKYFMDTYGYTEKLSKFNTLVDDLNTIGTTAQSYYKNLSKAMALQEAEEERVAFLLSMKEAASDNTAFCKAVDEIVKTIEASYAELALDEAINTMLNHTLKKAFNSFLSALSKAGCESASSILSGMSYTKLGMSGLDLLFNTNDTSTNNIKLAMLYTLDQYGKQVIIKARSNYISSGNEFYAIRLINNYTSYVAYQQYATNWSQGYITDILFDGLVNSIKNLFSDSSKITYETYQELFEMDNNKYASRLDNLDIYYEIYNMHMNVTYKFTGSSSGSSNTDSNLVKIGSITYRLYQNKYAHIYDCDEDITSITIPQSITNDGITYKVNTILPFAFQNCIKMSSISIPSTILDIGCGAFERCTSLTSITLPSKIKAVESYAFEDCSALKSIVIPNGVKRIGLWAFKDCTSLRTITLPGSLEDVDAEAYTGCTITKVNIADGSTLVSSILFDGLRENVKEVVIPDSVESMGKSMLEGCYALKKLTIPYASTTNQLEGASDTQVSDLFIADSYYPCEISGGYAIRTIVITGGDEIPSHAFYGMDMLEEIILPDTIKKIGERAFYNCTGLTSITIPDSVTTIGAEAFRDCTGLTSVTIPDSVTTIGEGAFESCTSLTDIVIPDSVTTIGNSAFSSCTSLASIVIPDSVTTIGNNAFQNCISFTEITITDSVTSIGKSAFEDCTNLSEISLPDSVTSIMDSTFKNCSSLEKISLINIEQINNYAFLNCSKLQEVNLSDSIWHIGYQAFNNCNNLESLIISNDLCSINNRPDTLPEDTVLYGNSNSMAHLYALDYDRKFISIDNAEFNQTHRVWEVYTGHESGSMEYKILNG